MARTSVDQRKLTMLRRMAVTFLAGLLMFYHTSLLVDLIANGSFRNLAAIAVVQSIVRILIVLSLALVVFRVKGAIAAMWLTISALVVSQYVAHFGGLAPELSEARSALSYLRGFIFPTAISLLFVKRRD